MPGIVAWGACRPYPGMEKTLESLLEDLQPTLRHNGLATDRPPLVLKERNGPCYAFVFEWASEDAARRAQSLPAVAALFQRFAEAGEFVPVASLAEGQKPFTHFVALDGR